ncbi:MAG: membrane dipeptidase [Gammaproteobacteria bacterium]|jgi:membrane dipeptidase
MKKVLLWTIPILIVLIVAALIVGPSLVETRINTVGTPPPYHARNAAEAVHAKLAVVDLHADSLLWGRDLTRESARGQADVPRLLRGGVALQVFAIVSKVPYGMNMYENQSDSDMILGLAMLDRWPLATWTSLYARAVYQAENLRGFAQASESLMLVRSRSDLDELLERRSHGERVMGALLAVEGAQVLEGDLRNLDRLYERGLRMVGFTHFFDNRVGGSAHGMEKGGLKPFGRYLVAALEKRGMIIDLAHASPALIDDVLALATRPVVVSHTGVEHTCESPRNLSDGRIDAVARNGGLIGIALFKGAVCGDTLADTARAMRYVANRVGVEHLALGTDFDGAVRTPIDATGLVLVTQALQDAQFSESEIALIMGGNALRLLRELLP